MMRGKKKVIIMLSAILCVVTTIVYALLSVKKSKDLSGLSAEMLMEMKYDQVEDADTKVDGCDGIKFSAFFTRDLDNDGKAEKIKGTCKEIGQNDTLYVELNVLTQGYLKDGVITLDAKNFTWTTAIVSDNVVEGDYIGNTKEIKLKEQLNAGTQKTFWGTIDADLKDNKDNYSQVSSVTLSGTYVTGKTDGTTTEQHFSKKVDLNVDWYGKTTTEVNKYYYNSTGYESYQNQKYDIDTLVDGDNVKVNFQVAVAEVSRQLILEEQKVEITIPKLNGKDAIDAKSTGGNVTSVYDRETGILTVTRSAVKDENGKITSTIARSNLNNIEVTYPLEAYTSTNSNSISLNVPIKAYNSGYNNENNGFQHPYKSEAEGIIALAYSEVEGDVWNAYTYVGDKVYDATTRQNRYEVSKEAPINIYNGNVYEDEDDKYTVEWQLATGKYGEQMNGFTLEEAEKDVGDGSDKFLNTLGEYESMKDYIRTTGIYFSNASNFLGNDGWIELYTEDGESPIHKFTAENWGNYSKTSPFEVNLGKIKIKTSKPQNNQVFSVYQIKEIDDSKIIGHYEKTQFEKLSYIYTYLKATGTTRTNIDVETTPKADGESIEGLSETNDGGTATAEGTTVDNSKITSEIYAFSFARYDVPYSVQRLSISPSQITNQKTEDIKFTISTSSLNLLEKGWTNGVFLLELPEKILDFKVNKVTPSNDVKIKSYNTYEENGKYYVKISTENDEEAFYNIDIEASITADPLETTRVSDVKLYAYNENCDNYKESTEDVHNIDNDGHTEDFVGTTNSKISIIAPSGLLTTEYVTNYDDNEQSMTVAPNVADIEKADGERNATINVSITNNYSGTISDVVILGKTPYQGNKYTITEETLNSSFTACMTEGIKVPQDLEGKVAIYYSTKADATKDLEDEENEWEADTAKVDWSQVKTYLICFNDYRLKENDKYIFSYNVKIPGELEYNKASFSHHAVFYNLDTENGKLAIETEPNKVGIQIVSKYDFKLTKNKKASNNIFVAGATYSLTTEDVDKKPIIRTATTNEQGTLQLSGLYVGREYTLKEISSTDDYVVSDEEIKFKTSIDGEGNFSVQEIDGKEKNTLQAKEDENGNNLVEINVEDEAKYTLIINKKDEENNPLSDVKFTLKGKGKNVSVKTNKDGQLIVTGLYPGEKYQLQETRADGYYVDQKPREFTVKRDESNQLQIETEDEQLEKAEIKVEDGKVQAIMEVDITNEKIPTYDLKIVKVEENNKKKELSELNKLENATFIIEGTNIEIQEEYTTDKDGEITIPNLYAHVDEKYIDGKYTIQETKAPNGYSNNGEEIHLQVNKKESGLEVIIDNQEELQTVKDAKVEDNTVILIIQDKPLFKLTKTDSVTGEPLANAKFVIYELDEDGHEVDYAKDANDKYVGEEDEYGQYIVTTDEHGTVSLPLRPGTYKAVEVGYPEGYQEDSDEQFFKVAGNKEESDDNEEVEDGEKDNLREVKISTKQGLIEFRNNVNSGANNGYEGWIVKLEDDIDLSGEEFVPIGDYSHQFKGIFDGQEHEIKNLNISGTNPFLGLFGYVKDGEIKNVGVTGKINGNGQYIGGIVGEAEGSTTISNCYNLADISSTHSNGMAGGIVGLFNATTISDCYNLGNINLAGSGGYSSCVGGIAGRALNTINNCYNAGKIVSNYTGMIPEVGGIAGYSDKPISYCHNIGEIVLENGVAGRVGGIVGEGRNVNDCYNLANMSVHAESRSGYVWAGGIIGSGSTISDCYNTGDISGTSGSGSSENDIGGIAGTSGKINNCYNEGDVSNVGNAYVGGIIGDNGESTSDCYNTGDIRITSGSNTFAGGIVGDGYNCNISNCYDTGNVYCSGTGDRVGVGSIVGREEATVKNCYYLEGINIDGNKIIWSGNKVTDAEMRQDTPDDENLFYNKLNVDDVWEKRPNKYPILTEKIPPDLVDVTELEVKNTIKKFKITTEVEGKRGGQITGSGQEPFKTVEYDGSYNKENEGKDGYDKYEEIVMTPSTNYGIISVTINGEVIDYEEKEDNKYTIPDKYFENMREDKHIVVSYALKNQTLTVKKTNKEGEALKGAKFGVEQTSPTLSIGPCNQYGLRNTNGVYISDNKNIPNSTAQSLCYIYLGNKTGKYVVVINAEISSEENADIGYASISKGNPVFTSENNFMCISGKQGAKNYVSPVMEGGNVYWLNLGYAKNDSVDEGDDCFKINSAKLVSYDEIETNANGEMKIAMDSQGTYTICEIEAPDGYMLDSDPQVVTVGAGKENEVTFQNGKQPTVTVHHYLKDSNGQYTTKSVAPDQVYRDDIGKQYYTQPHTDLENLSLEINAEGKIVIPDKASGTYTENPIEINYYYEANPINLTIHHYLEGTEDSLVADKVIQSKANVTFTNEGEYIVSTDSSYELKTNDEYKGLLKDYELSRIETTIQANVDIEDTLNYNRDSEITYYYTLKKHNITTEVKTHTENRTNSVTKVRENTEVKGGKVSAKYTDKKTIESDEEQFVEEVKQKEDSTAEITATPDEGYKVSKIKLISTADDGTKTETTIYDETIAKDKENDESKEGETSGEIKEPDTKEDTNPGADGSDEGDESDKADESKQNNDDKISYEVDKKGAITLKGASGEKDKVFEEVTQNKHIVVEFAPILGKLVIHHYMVGTGEEHSNTPVRPLSKDGVTPVEDETREDYVGENYATKANENINKRYKLVSTSEKTSGAYTDGVTNVYYYYDLDDFAYTVHYFYDGVENKDKMYQGPKERFGKVIRDYLDESDGYVFDRVTPVDSEDSAKAYLTITENEEENVINVYYVTSYKITTNVVEHEEKYSDGKIETVEGGTITIKDAELPEDVGKSEEDVVRGKDTKGDIVIVPEDGYEIARVTIKDRDGESNLDIESFVKEDGTITLNAENDYFKNVTSNKNVEVEFRKKTKVTVKYLVKDTKESVSEEVKDVIINGLEGEKYSTERKTVTNYRPAEVELVDGSLASETFEKTETDGTFTYSKYDENAENRMFADEVTIIYWYEKIPEGKVIVRHIEIDENDIRKGLTMDSGIELKVEVQSIEEIISKAKMEASKKLNANNGTQSAIRGSSDGAQTDGTANSEEKGNSAEKSGNGATEGVQNGENSEGAVNSAEGANKGTQEITNKEAETVGNSTTENNQGSSTGEGSTKSGENGDTNNNGNNKEISGTEGDNQDTEEGNGNAQGSQSANTDETSKDGTGDGSNVAENGSNGNELGNGENQNTANGSANNTIVDNENGESTKEEYTGLVETTQATARRTFTDKETGRNYASIDGPVSDDEDIIVVGKDANEYLAKIVEKDDDGDGQIDTVEVRYYYIRQYKVTTEVKLHAETIDGVETMVKGGNIEISGLGAEELVNRMGSNSKQIVATPDRKYKVKSITINGELINIEDLRDENGIVRLGEKYLDNITEDKNIVVEYEKLPGKVVVKYLEDGTDKELSKEVEINGISDDKYKAYPKAIDGYELVMEKYPQNEEGIMAPEDTIVVYYYRAIQPEPDVMPENPTGAQNALGGTSNGTTNVKTGDNVIFSVIAMIVAGAVILVINIRRNKIGKHENRG